MVNPTLYSKGRTEANNSDLITAKTIWNTRLQLLTYLCLLKKFTVIISTLIQILQEWLYSYSTQLWKCICLLNNTVILPIKKLIALQTNFFVYLMVQSPNPNQPTSTHPLMMCLLLFLSRIFMGYTVVLHPGCTACLLPGIQDNLVITVFCSYLSYLLSGSRWAVLYYIIDCTFMGPAQSVLLESYWHLTKLHCHSQPTSSFSFL